MPLISETESCLAAGLTESECRASNQRREDARWWCQHVRVGDSAFREQCETYCGSSRHGTVVECAIEQLKYAAQADEAATMHRNYLISLTISIAVLAAFGGSEFGL
jgi:hypothetical protein